MPYITDPDREPLVQWRAVLAGTVIGLAVLALLVSLWSALAYGSGVALFRETFAWWIGGSAIFAIFLAGSLAGAASGVRGPSAGMMTGLTVWALATIAIVALGIPSVVASFRIDDRLIVAATAGPTFWTLFWSVFIGFGAALFGGMIGAMSPRVAAVQRPVRTEHGTLVQDVRGRTGTEG